MLLSAVLLGRSLEDIAKSNAAAAIAGLLSRAPDHALLVHGNGSNESLHTVRVSTRAIHTGDRILASTLGCGVGGNVCVRA